MKGHIAFATLAKFAANQDGHPLKYWIKPEGFFEKDPIECILLFIYLKALCFFNS